MAKANLFLEQFFQKAEEEFWAFTFDDLLLVPQRSEVIPTSVDLTTRLTTNITMKIPFSSAAMDRVTEAPLAIEMAKAGGVGIIHRNLSVEEQAREAAKVKNQLNAKIESPITIHYQKTIGDLLALMDEKGYRFTTFIAVDDNQKLKGLVTKDILERTEAKDKIEDVMQKKVVACGLHTTVKEAYDQMKDSSRRIGKLVIIKNDETVAGLYTWSDVREIVEGKTPTYNRDDKGRLIVGAAIGVQDYKRAEALLKRGVDVLVVDTSHGHSKNVFDTVVELKKNFRDEYEFDIIAGNVATRGGANYLIEAGADAVKVGIGPGSICTTRVVTGAGMPQMSAIYNAIRACIEKDIPVIADGGIAYSGDVTKALAAGASSVMLGSILAGAEEAPGEMFTVGGKRFREYRGMGSVGAMQKKGGRDRYHQSHVAPEKVVPQGIEGQVPIIGPVSDILYQFCGGVSAGMGLLGAKTIPELWANARFVRITGAGKVENHPHGVQITREAPNYQVE